MKKADRTAKKQREDQTLNRVLWWFGGAVVLEFFLLLLNRFYFVDNNGGNVELSRGIYQFLRVFAWAALAVTVVLAVLAVLRGKIPVQPRRMAPTKYRRSLSLMGLTTTPVLLSAAWTRLPLPA